MRRLTILLVGAAALAALALLSGLVTQGFQELGQAETEREALEQRRLELEREIAEFEAMLAALESDPAAVESLARDQLGWVRPGEQVILLVTPTPPPLPIDLTQPTPTPILSLRD